MQNRVARLWTATNGTRNAAVLYAERHRGGACATAVLKRHCGCTDIGHVKVRLPLRKGNAEEPKLDRKAHARQLDRQNLGKRTDRRWRRRSKPLMEHAHDASIPHSRIYGLSTRLVL